MERARVALLTLLVAACGAPAPVSVPPSPAAAMAVSASPTLCPNVLTVQKFIDAMVRFDGQAAAALFSTDGFMQTDFTNSGGPVRFVGAQRIAPVIARADVIREREIIEQPRGCDTVTWVQRELPVQVGRGTDLRGTATLQDGKLASVVFVVQQQ